MANEEFLKSLKTLLDDKGERNYDPRMEELMRSDKLIDPKAENLSKLEDQEIFHVSKIRGAQKGFTATVRQVKKIYELPWMKDYHTEYIDYIRSLDWEKDKDEINTVIGGLPMTSEMVTQLISLRGALEAWKAKLYADSIKPQVINNPQAIPPQEPQEGLLAKLFGFFLGKKQEQPQYKR